MTRVTAALYITADDGAQNPEIDRGIVQLTKTGILTGVAAFATYGRLPSLCKALPPETVIGIHLNISSGTSISKPSMIPTLVDSRGRFIGPSLDKDKNISKSLAQYATNHVTKIDKKDIMTELREQLLKFINETGDYPAFSCIHHDLDINPNVRDVIADLLPSTPTRQLLIRQNKLTGVFCELFEASDRLPIVIYKLKHLVINAIDYSFANNGIPSEVVCHPGYVSQKMNEFTVYRLQRRVELDAWLSDEIRSIFDVGNRKKCCWFFDQIPKELRVWR